MVGADVDHKREQSARLIQTVVERGADRLSASAERLMDLSADRPPEPRPSRKGE
jgi:hypothetical protein